MGLSRSAFIAAGSACLLCGCVFFDVAEQHRLDRGFVRLEGTIVVPEAAPGSVVVLLVHWPENEGEPEVIDHYVRAGAGRFYFATTRPGRYSLPAFVDLNDNQHFDPDEPAIGSTTSNTFDLEPGDHRQSIELAIRGDDRVSTEGPVDILALQARSVADQVGTTMTQLTVSGDVTELSDPRFGRDNASSGLWRPIDFIFEVGAGIYFLEPYDPARTPVLFVHGIGGTPQDFTHAIAGLDRSRFQAWVYYYPSGGKLAQIAEHLSRTMDRLESRLRIDSFLVVAHSMGGLVARGFLLHHEETMGSAAARMFVTLSTPWQGHDWAETGVKYAPAVVYSWIDVAPGSDYLSSLFYRSDGERRRLTLPHHLLFGFNRDASLPGLCSDQVVSVSSQLRTEAQEEAATRHGYDKDHVGILQDPGALDRLHALLASAPGSG